MSSKQEQKRESEARELAEPPLRYLPRDYASIAKRPDVRVLDEGVRLVCATAQASARQNNLSPWEHSDASVLVLLEHAVLQAACGASTRDFSAPFPRERFLALALAILEKMEGKMRECQGAFAQFAQKLNQAKEH